MKIKRIITDVLQFVSRLIPDSSYPRWVRREVISIFYHAVSDGPLDHVQHLYPVVPVTEFKKALQTMQERFTFVNYEQLQDHVLGKAALPPKAVHLSFDDGFSVCFHVVKPILLEQRIPCTFFLTLDWLDNHRLYFRHRISLYVARMAAFEVDEQAEVIQKINQRLRLSLKDRNEFIAWITAFREPQEPVLTIIGELLGVDSYAYLNNNQPYLTRDQVQEMHDIGFTIGAHGLSHRKLGFISRQEVEKEIVDSCRGVQAITGQKVVPFSFPQSAGNVDRNQLADIRTRYPEVGLLFDTKDLRLDAPFMVNRVWAERPLTSQRKLHPLPQILTHAYREAWVEERLGYLRKWTPKI